MIIREIKTDPIGEIARFDFLNDYKDTRRWALTECRYDVVILLDAAHDVWLRERWLSSVIPVDAPSKATPLIKAWADRCGIAVDDERVIHEWPGELKAFRDGWNAALANPQDEPRGK